jgi:hypothetical protein
MEYAYLQQSVLSLNSDNLVPNQLQYPIDHGLEALQNLLVRERHIAFLNACFWELSLNTHINSPLLAIVPEICLDPVLKVHNALGVHLTRRLGAVWKLHLTNLGTQDVGEITVQSCRAARVTRTRCALCDCEGLLFFDFICNQVDSATATVDDQDGVVDLEIKETGFGTEHGCCFRLGDEGETVVVLVP